MRLFGCAKFRRLANEEIDRELTGQETAFMARHRDVCPDCEAYEAKSSSALNMLRAAALDVEAHPQFDERVIRKLRVQSTRESIRYWSPAVAGAFIAGLAVVAALQMITRSGELPHVKLPGGEAKRVTMPKIVPFSDEQLRSMPPR